MKKEDKELLLRDLYSRLIYGVKCCGIEKNSEISKNEILRRWSENTTITVDSNVIDKFTKRKYEVLKPYLRSMTSISDVDADKLADVSNSAFGDGHEPSIIVQARLADVRAKWFDENMFDHRGLISRGLAFEAPKGMYKCFE